MSESKIEQTIKLFVCSGFGANKCYWETTNGFWNW